MKPQDRPFRIGFAGDLDSQRGELLSGRDFRLDMDALHRFFIGDPSPRFIDLLRIGMAVYIVDRLVRRGRDRSRPWRRNLQIRVDVLDADFWNNTEVGESLHETVEFLTGDFWDIRFSGQRSGSRWSKPLLTPAFAAETPLICLYSGGLDSAAGLGLRTRGCLNRPVIPVTVKHQPRQNSLIENQYDLLRKRHQVTIDPLVIKAARIRTDGTGLSKEEPSQRGRSFLFAVAGAVAASMSGMSEVEVFESGIGSINVPLLSGMVGSRATRGCHPEFFRLMSCLVSLVADREITFRLPFLDSTKAEMVRSIKDAGLADLAVSTVSCARYPVGIRRYVSCGVCSACLFRRQAMIVGGIDEPSGTYTIDLFGRRNRVNAVKPERLAYLKAYLMQAADWAEIESTGRLPDSVQRHLRHTHNLMPDESLGRFSNLLCRYRDEWFKIAEQGRKRGYRWAGLLARVQPPVEQGASHAIA
jgi:7-cyano-7-deazaguanine synthase in queuosine biosynthesis